MSYSSAALPDKCLNRTRLNDFGLKCTTTPSPVSAKAALRAIIPRHNHCLHGLPAATRERVRLVVVYQGTSCPCGVTSKPLVSHMWECVCMCVQVLSVCWGLECQGNSQPAQKQKRLLTLILSPTRSGVAQRARAGVWHTWRVWLFLNRGGLSTGLQFLCQANP